MIVDRGLRRTKSPVGHRRRKPKSPAPEPFDDAPAARPASPKVRVPGALDGDFHFTTALAFRMSPPAGRYRPRTTPAAALGQRRSRARRANVPRHDFWSSSRATGTPQLPGPLDQSTSAPRAEHGSTSHFFFSLSLSFHCSGPLYICTDERRDPVPTSRRVHRAAARAHGHGGLVVALALLV